MKKKIYLTLTQAIILFNVPSTFYFIGFVSKIENQTEKGQTEQIMWYFIYLIYTLSISIFLFEHYRRVEKTNKQ